MSDDTLTYDEAVGYLPEGDDVHTFIPVGPTIIGGDWMREEILRALRVSPSILITGNTAQSMGHGMAVTHPRFPGETVFVQTTGRTDGGPSSPPSADIP